MAPYKHKRSSTPGKVPTAGDFQDGEILLNTADGRLFVLAGSTVREVRNLTDNDARYMSNSRITISTADPSGGVEGDIWFKV